MKLSRLAILAIALVATITDNAAQFAPFGQLPDMVQLPSGEYAIFKKYLCPSDFSENGTHPYYGDINFSSPQITLVYSPPPVISGSISRVAAALKQHKAPTIILRVPPQCQDAKFVEMIETKLVALGLNVLDHNLSGGSSNPAEIRKKSGADILLDISWLKFSDPEMFTQLDRSATKIGEIKFNPISVWAATFPSKDKLLKYIAKSRNKNRWEKIKNGISVDYPVEFNYDLIRQNISDGISQSECFEKNKNVISAIFKFIDLSDGSLIGFFHVGQAEQSFTVKPVPFNKIGNAWDLGEKVNNSYSYTSHRFSQYIPGARVGDDRIRKPSAPWDIENYRTYTGAEPAAMVLTYLSSAVRNDIREIPYAAELNDFQDVKISHGQILESTQTNSSSSGTSNGYGRTSYHRHFNSSYYSGSSQSSTSSSSSSTTTFRDAEYLRCSDFYGYYAPLADKLVTELRKLLR